MWPKELNPYRENKQKQRQENLLEILNWLPVLCSLYSAPLLHRGGNGNHVRASDWSLCWSRDISHRERITVCLWDWCRPRSMARSQAADGRPDCSHIRREVVNADERNRSLTFGLRKTQFSQLVWTEDPRKLMLKILSQSIASAHMVVGRKWD